VIVATWTLGGLKMMGAKARWSGVRPTRSAKARGRADHAEDRGEDHDEDALEQGEDEAARDLGEQRLRGQAHAGGARTMRWRP
jgi:hypothetical protein